MPKGNNYEVHKRFLKTVDFEVLVLKIPDDYIEDKLTYLVTEKGQITRSLFEDFLFAHCIANLNQLMFHLNQSISYPPDLLKVREELLDFIWEINPLLVPNNLVINTNHVVKIKTGKRVKKGEIVLDKNKSWNNSTYEDLFAESASVPAGWAIDKNGNTITGVVIEALDKFLRERKVS